MSEIVSESVENVEKTSQCLGINGKRGRGHRVVNEHETLSEDGVYCTCACGGKYKNTGPNRCNHIKSVMHQKFLGNNDYVHFKKQIMRNYYDKNGEALKSRALDWYYTHKKAVDKVC